MPDKITDEELDAWKLEAERELYGSKDIWPTRKVLLNRNISLIAEIERLQATVDALLKDHEGDQR